MTLVMLCGLLILMIYSRLYSKVWPMLSIFDSNKQKTPLEISVAFDRWGAVLYLRAPPS
jgi:hypothetical protein